MSRKKPLFFALPVIFCAGLAQADTLTFENGATGPFSYDPSHVLVFDFDTSGEDPRTGYGDVVAYTGSSWLAVNPDEYDWEGHNPSVFDYLGGGTFTLDSLVIAGAFGTQTVLIGGVKADGTALTRSVDLTLAAQEVTFDNWNDLTQFSIALTGNYVADPVLKAAKVGNGEFWALDNVTYSPTAVPEPETYAMLLAGLAIVGLLGSKRRANRFTVRI